MTKDDFIQAKCLMFSDIHREIELARAVPETLKSLGVTPGGGNFLATLGLLCYTEFGGKLLFGAKHKDGRDDSSGNFNLFFDLLGPDYQEFRRKHNVYDIFRCGLAHEYYVKKSCSIYILEKKPSLGLGIESAGRYFFIVESYARDLIKAFDHIEKNFQTGQGGV